MSELIKALVVLALEDGDDPTESLTALLAAAIILGRDCRVADEDFLRMVEEMLAVREGMA